ncbi:MAG TPA: hypothetical protein VJP02_12900 [Candidatus Sulfotelmatobacter sp.]|nr:hypothetical protein [Candidatus Sulfotelmatobacter sp.]
MTYRLLVTLLITTMLWTCTQTLAQDLVSPKLLPPASALRVTAANRHLALDMATDPPSQTATPHRHWSKGGKVMTIIGAGLVGAGTAALIHGQNTQVACSNGTCASIAWRATGAIWMGGGAALVIVGATRRTED